MFRLSIWSCIKQPEIYNIKESMFNIMFIITTITQSIATKHSYPI
jgi:hypothetical protein